MGTWGEALQVLLRTGTTADQVRGYPVTAQPGHGTGRLPAMRFYNLRCHCLTWAAAGIGCLQLTVAAPTEYMLLCAPRRRVDLSDASRWY
jgi:hypothetical protein